MDPRTMAHAQFPFYPLMQLGAGASLVAPRQSFQNTMSMVGSNLGFAHSSALGLQVPQPSPHWMYNSPSPAVNSPFLNSAHQTALLLAKLHRQSMEHIQNGMNLKNMQLKEESCVGYTVPSIRNVSSTLEKQTHVPVTPESKKRSMQQSPAVAKQPKLITPVDSEDSSSEKGENKAQGLRGERRLVISFDCLGTRGDVPQTFGKSGAIIPNGVAGTHTVYNERWRFEVTHGQEVFSVEKMKCICITWSVTNLATGMVTSMTETRDEAVIRNSQGQTISNKVFREALENRARDLERRLKDETNPKRALQMEALIRGLRPKRFSEGPLIFGLQHKVVQDKMLESVKA